MASRAREECKTAGNSSTQWLRALATSNYDGSNMMFCKLQFGNFNGNEESREGYALYRYIYANIHLHIIYIYIRMWVAVSDI